jgi:4-diphosphocytidyl-2-C-methyl-D-erythritol kinase
MKAVRALAHGKVNLTLEVVGRRDDGYHELRSVIARISLADDVRVARARAWRTIVRPALGIAPHAELATRAARALAREVDRSDGVALSIRKRIPPASGLGGGSSDAAAVLRALARLWMIDDATTVRRVAATIGSDVPFFLDGPAAEVRGRGEDVRAISGGPWDGVLVLPRCRVSTDEAFARLPREAWSDGARTADLIGALANGSVGAARLRDHCVNAFDAVQSMLCPQVSAVRESVPGTRLFLSGSGPSLFALCASRAEALFLRRRIRRAGHRALLIAIGVPSE